MTQEEIIRMAREAGADVTSYINYCFDDEVVLFYKEELERFFNLAFEAGVKQEREKQVDLTDEDIHKLVKQVRFDGMADRTFQFARAVIAAFKEKNK